MSGALALHVAAGGDVVDQDGIYCGSRCGIGCTRKAYDRAVSEAIALASLMGEGWEPRVWENLGWHYEAAKGVGRILPETKGGGSISGEWQITGYSAWINHERGGQSICRAATPHEAMSLAIEDCRLKLVGMLSELDALRPFPLTIAVVVPAIGGPA